MPTTTNYIWDDDNLLAEADGTNTINTVYTNEPQQHGNLISTRVAGSTSYHHFDALGSTRQLTNSAGTVTDRMHYDSWGNLIARQGTAAANLLWAGELGYYSDGETGLCSVRRRVYSPPLARWNSTDPLLFAGMLNLFEYCSNRPNALVDPSGNLEIRPLNDTFNRPRCGTTIELSWDFFLSQRHDCAGYFVQEVEVRCEIKSCFGFEMCPNMSSVDPDFVYYEAFWVEPRQIRQEVRRLGRAGFTDRSTAQLANNTCGLRSAIGTVKFFCVETTGDLGQGGQAAEKAGARVRLGAE